jgi:predicted helicase
MRDDLVVAFNESELERVVSIAQEEPSKLLSLSKRVKLKDIQPISDAINSEKYSVANVVYRPFDIRKMLYHQSNGGTMWRSRGKLMAEMLERENVGIGISRTVYGSYAWQDAQIVNTIVEKGFMAMRISNAAKVYPLYIHHNDGTRTPNMDAAKLKEFTKNLSTSHGPEDILHFIYATLYSPKYREKYQEFLKIDFPRVLPPKNDTEFKRLCTFGEELRELHLMKSPVLDSYDTTYSEPGGNEVEKVVFEGEKVWINDKQYFGKVPETAWIFYIGGYQPAQKWLKDRKGRKLTSDDINHYQKIIKILVETDRIMREIDQVRGI